MAGQRVVADPHGGRVVGRPEPDGARLDITIEFRLFEWPWEERGPVSLVPQPANVIAGSGNDRVELGYAIPDARSVIVPLTHSSSARVTWTLSLTNRALAALEAKRRGRALNLELLLVAHPFARNEQVWPTMTMWQFDVARDEWITALDRVGFADILVTELRLPDAASPGTEESHERLAAAVRDRNDGKYEEAMQKCRIALDALGHGGFGGKAPPDVMNFLRERGPKMNPGERLGALRAAAELFLAQAHHAGAPEMSREDADIALAITASLLKVAPRWAPPQEPHPPAAQTPKDGAL